MTCARNWWSLVVAWSNNWRENFEGVHPVSGLHVYNKGCIFLQSKTYNCKCITPSQDRAYKKVSSFCMYSYCLKARNIVVLHLYLYISRVGIVGWLVVGWGKSLGKWKSTICATTSLEARSQVRLSLSISLGVPIGFIQFLGRLIYHASQSVYVFQNLIIYYIYRL